MRLVRAIGQVALAVLNTVGAVSLFALRGLAALLTGPWFFGQLLRQLSAIGFFSLPVVGLTADMVTVFGQIGQV